MSFKNLLLSGPLGFYQGEINLWHFFEVIVMYPYYVKYFHGPNRYFTCKTCLEIDQIIIIINKQLTFLKHNMLH